MFRKAFILIVVCTASGLAAAAQKVALKNNLLLDATASVNLGVEFKAGARSTVLVPGSFNLWKYDSEARFKHAALQPEFRWWLCAPFTGHFFGVHVHGAFYNVGGMGPFDALKEYRYQGWLAGAGASWGYNWIVAPRWSIEATVGVGYAYLSYDKYRCRECGRDMGHSTKHWFGPTKLAVTVEFLIK